MLNVLITGVPGWLGNTFLKLALKDKNLNVRCLVKHGMDTSSIPRKAQIVKGDVRELYSLLEATRDIDIVFHIAGLIHARPKDLYVVNYYGTLNMLEASYRAGVSRFVYVSSNAAAGYTKDRTLMTEGHVCNPYMSYGKSKFLAEQAVLGYINDNKLRGVILRPCMYYGSTPPPRHIKLYRMISKGRPIIVGDGMNIRSLTYVGSLCEVMHSLCYVEPPSNLYWIADKRPYTTIELYRTIADALNVECSPVYIPSLFGKMCRALDRTLQSIGLYSTHIHVLGEMPLNIACSVEKAIKELDFNPRESLEEGIKESIRWCKLHGYL